MSLTLTTCRTCRKPRALVTRTTGAQETVFRVHHLPGQDGIPYADRVRCPESRSPVPARAPRRTP